MSLVKIAFFVKKIDPYDRNSRVQPISIRKAKAKANKTNKKTKKQKQKNKQKQKLLRTSWISHKMCQPCLAIIQSCYFDCIIYKPFAYSLFVIYSIAWNYCNTQSPRTTRAKDHRHFNLNYPQVNEVRKSVHMDIVTGSRPREGILFV